MNNRRRQITRAIALIDSSIRLKIVNSIATTIGCAGVMMYDQMRSPVMIKMEASSNDCQVLSKLSLFPKVECDL